MNLTLEEGEKLQGAGHAVSIALIYDAEGRKEMVKVEHYRTCTVCLRITRRSVLDLPDEKALDRKRETV